MVKRFHLTHLPLFILLLPKSATTEQKEKESETTAQEAEPTQNSSLPLPPQPYHPQFNSSNPNFFNGFFQFSLLNLQNLQNSHHSMATYLLILLYFSTFCFKSLIAHSNSSFSFNNFGPNSSFESLIALYGDANVVNGALQLTAPSNSSAGRLIYKTPIKFHYGNPRKLVSFSTHFSFSMSSNSTPDGDGLAFVVFSDGFPVDAIDENGQFGLPVGGDFKFLSVEFDTSMDSKYGDVNGNHVGIDLSTFVSLKSTNLSSLNLGLNSGNRLQVWIDYESSSRRLEVRLSRFGETRPFDPVLFERIDLGEIWPENEGFYVGLSSSNGNSSQLCNVYSWSFRTRETPDWMHSEPLEPMAYKEKKENEIKIRKKSDCVLRVLSALVLGVGLGALGSLIGMFMWTIFANKRPVAPEEYGMKPVADDKPSATEKQ